MAVEEVNIRKKTKNGIDFIRRQERTFKINLIRASSMNFLLSTTQQYEPLLITGLGANPFLLGVINGLGGFIWSIISLPAGWLADKHGIRRILLLATPIMAIGALLFGLAPNLLMIAIAVVALFSAKSMLYIACPMVCGSCLKTHERATGMQLCDTVTAVPSIFAPMVGAFIITAFGGMSLGGIRPLYYLQSIGLLLTFFFAYKFFQNPSRKKAFKSSEFAGGVRNVFDRGTDIKRWILFKSLSSVPLFVSVIYIPLYASEIKGADQFILGGMATTSMVLPILLSIVMGRMADSIGRKKVIYLITPLQCLSLLLLVTAQNSSILLLSGLLQGFVMLGMVTEGAMTAELVPIGLLGSWYGLLGLFRGVISVLGPFVAGAIWSIFNPESVFFFLIATQLVKIVILLTIPETLKAPRKR